MIETSASHIRALRLQAKLTQEEVAHRVGVSLITYKRWEYGDFEPRTSDIQKLCEIFKCDESELLNGPEEKRWNLKVTYATSIPALTIPAGKIVSELHIANDEAMAVTLAGPFDLWEDDEKFEDFINQLRKERTIGLKTKQLRDE